MAEYTSNYNLEKPAETEFYDVAVQNGNMDKIDEAIASIDTAKADAKSTLADGDAVSIVDSADSSKTKRVLWSTFKSALGQLFVPLTRKINNKALSSDLNLTGEDIPTSDTDSTSISSQLSNKVNAVIENVSTEDSLIDYVNDNQIGFFTDWAGVTPGAFSSGLFVRGLDQKNASIIGVDDDGIPYFGGVNIKNRTVSYKTGATATPPQEYDLPLSEGITALQPCTYYKNQFGEVTLGGCTSGSVSDGATIATLPEGFRPDHPIEHPATFTTSGNQYAGSVFITANGIVSIHTPAEATNVVFAASFLAKN